MTSSSLSMGRVALTVHDLPLMRDYYQSAVGLHLLSEDGESARLGIGSEVLLELRLDKQARRRSAHEAGLFHTAFLLPHRGDLARWTRDAIAKRTAVTGASDHLVSEAVYLDDPEGNGIEIYTDRARDAWSWKEGKVEMASLPLDVEGLLKAEPEGKWQGVPEGTVVGHVHLQAGDLAEAEGFYAGVMGLDVTCYYPGAVFYAADGYHHHMATNIWNSRGAHPRSFPSTGLADVEVRLSQDRAAAIAARAGDSATLLDPWGTPISLTLTA